jgi:type II secretory pathway pseudopilin PulG
MRRAEEGFSLVGLLAGTTIMLILMGAAVPSWKYVMKDAREEELLFRGIQIAEAIERYQKKNGNAPPPSLEVLVKGKYLRKPFTEPMAKNGKWRFVRPGEALPVPGRPGTPLPGKEPPAPPAPGPLPDAPQVGGGAPGMIVGGFIGVASTSKEKSLRMFNGRTRYNEWLFVAGQPRVIGKQTGPMPAPGSAPGSAPGPGGPPVPPPQPPK